MSTGTQIPFVEYLVLADGEPHLVAHQCTACGARFFDRRNACAGCSGTEFTNALRRDRNAPGARSSMTGCCAGRRSATTGSRLRVGCGQARTGSHCAHT